MQRVFGPDSTSGFEAGSHLPRSAARVSSGEVLHLGAHLDRLRASAAFLGWDASWIEGEAMGLADWVRERTAEQAHALALRLHLRPRQLRALLEPVPSTPSPYLLLPMPHPLGSPDADPRAPHKGLTGIWGAEARDRAQAAGAADAALHWADGTLVETGIASLGLQLDGSFWLPPAAGRIASLAERLDLPPWAGSRGLRIGVRAFSVEEAAAGQLWCFNALRGFWRAALVDPRR
ncbi:MAG TPA: aminotransferase class IV [Holophagaceae bacterium]|nr:aminotransferase class IV [Holophagaceae bacterium]